MALHQSAQNSYWAPVAAAAAGMATSIGPCVSARFVAIVSLASNASGRERVLRVVSFVCGLCLGYVALGSTISALVRIAQWSPYVYGGLAMFFGILGIRSIVTAGEHRCRTSASRAGSVARSFLLGVSFSLVASPCCAPIVVALAGIAAAVSSPLPTVVVVAAFAIGHTLPLAITGVFAAGVWRRLERFKLDTEIATVNAGLLLGVAGYYGLLA